MGDRDWVTVTDENSGEVYLSVAHRVIRTQSLWEEEDGSPSTRAGLYLLSFKAVKPDDPNQEEHIFSFLVPGVAYLADLARAMEAEGEPVKVSRTTKGGADGDK